ncbi:hypothetical protein C8F04DRAFT_1112751 [Mycena alexandri]|uniref:Uncharacterized protein n=1 Tax=Mycena alexandri TaxID=1745969 RepID=A0AAD6SMG9_9AGAR|nr:hypothetical protein C8F04DRAFT_1112751 [Mycena alexandri]
MFLMFFPLVQVFYFAFLWCSLGALLIQVLGRLYLSLPQAQDSFDLQFCSSLAEINPNDRRGSSVEAARYIGGRTRVLSHLTDYLRPNLNITCTCSRKTPVCVGSKLRTR